VYKNKWIILLLTVSVLTYKWYDSYNHSVTFSHDCIFITIDTDRCLRCWTGACFQFESLYFTFLCGSGKMWKSHLLHDPSDIAFIRNTVVYVRNQLNTISDRLAEYEKLNKITRMCSIADRIITNADVWPQSTVSSYFDWYLWSGECVSCCVSKC